MVNEARLEETEAGLVPREDGWFVLNAREAQWFWAEGRPALCDFERDEPRWPELGVNICIVEPGQPMWRYHREADQEDFLVLAGEATAIVEDEERPLKAWDLLHCPPNTGHAIVGAGDGPCVIVAVGSRRFKGSHYPVNETAARYGASVREETTRASVAYAALSPHHPTRYREGWLPG
jgi:uncharacterized cupin superfamily protein